MFAPPTSTPSPGDTGDDHHIIDSAAMNSYYFDSSEEERDHSWKKTRWSSDPFISSEAENDNNTNSEFETDGFSDTEEVQSSNKHEDITDQPLSPFENLPSEVCTKSRVPSWHSINHYSSSWYK